MTDTMREAEETISRCDVGVVYNEDLPTVRKLRVAQMVVGEAWDAADTADEDDSRKAKIADAIRAVERALRAYGATVPK